MLDSDRFFVLRSEEFRSAISSYEADVDWEEMGFDELYTELSKHNKAVDQAREWCEQNLKTPLWQYDADGATVFGSSCET